MAKTDEFFSRVPKTKVLFNVGSFFDTITGTYLQGENDEYILSGGLAPVMGIAGRGNTFKSTVTDYLILSALNRYLEAIDAALVYDSEESKTEVRYEALAQLFDVLRELDAAELIHLTDTSMLGNDYFEQLKQYGAEKMKGKKSELYLEVPFLDAQGKKMKIIIPTIVGFDSLSMMPIKSVIGIYDDNEIGESGMNVEAMKTSAAKSQMLMQMPRLSATCGMNVLLVAHLDDEIQMDPRKPNAKRLGVMKQNTTFKRVPKNFSFLTNVLYETSKATPLWNSTSDKTSMYPRNSDDKVLGDMDLQTIKIQPLRNKFGPTGGEFEIVVSQTQGLLMDLTDFHFIKTRRFGLTGSTQIYTLDLYPDVKIQRTKIRQLIKEDAKLARACEIQSQLLQFRLFWKEHPPELLMTPDEIYKGLTEKGYDVNWILENTRNWWLPTNLCKLHPKRYLSTYDLCRLAAGTKARPKWMK